MKERIQYLVILLVILVTAADSFAQLNIKDSLYKNYLDEQNDSLKIRKGIFYAYELSKTSLDSAVVLLIQLKKTCVDKKIVSLYPRAAAELGNIYYEKGDYLKAITYSEQSINEYESAPVNKTTLLGKAWAYMWAGLSYSLMNDWENAQLNLQASVNASEQAGDTCRLINSSMNLAYIFYDMQNWQRMYETLKRNNIYLPGCKDADVSLMTTASLSLACSKLGKKTEAATALKNAKEFFNQKVTRSLEVFYYIASAELAIVNRNGKEAVEAALLAEASAQQSKDPYYIAFATELAGRAFITAGQQKDGLQKLLAALQLAKRNNFLAQQQLVLQQLTVYFEKQGAINTAYQYNKELLQLKDSLAEKINANRRLLLDARFETGKKETLISQLEAEKKIQQLTIRQKNTFNYLLIGSALALLIFLVLLYRNYRHKQNLQQQRINELETQQQLLATEAVLKGEEQERTRLAKDLHDGLGGMLSGIKYSFQNMKGNLILTPDNALAFERSMDMLDSSIKEMRRVAHNMMPETLIKYGLDTALKDFCNDINQSGAVKIIYQSVGMKGVEIEQTASITIYRIVQELVNNIIKHAAASQAVVQLNKLDEQLSITVEDNGKGFDKNLLINSSGMGWANIEKRVEFLKGKSDVQSEQGKGTSIHIEMHI